MVGTFAALFTWSVFGFDSNTDRPALWVALLAIGAALVVAAVASAIVALLLEITAYRPLRHRNAPPLAFLITAIGASFVLMELAGTLTVRRPFGSPALLPGGAIFDVGGWRVTPTQLTTVVVALAMMIGLDWYVQRTRAGRG